MTRDEEAVQYSTDLARVINSKRMYAKEFMEMTTLADQLTAYEVREDLPPDLRREFEECLASGLFEPSPVEE